MLSSRFQVTERTATRSTSSLPLGGTDQRRAKSGVYSTKKASFDLPEFLPLDDEPVTMVRHDKPEPGSSMPAAAPLSEQRASRPLWHVGMVLDADELSRLWARNSAALSARVFVWSDLANCWMALRGATPSSVTVDLRPMNRAGPQSIGHAQLGQAQLGQAQLGREGAVEAEFDDGGWHVDGAPPIELTTLSRLERKSKAIRQALVTATIGVCLLVFAGAALYRIAPVRGAQAAVRLEGVETSRDRFSAIQSSGERASLLTECKVDKTARGSVSETMIDDGAVPVEDLPVVLISRRLAPM